jgi:hypothetical protein
MEMANHFSKKLNFCDYIIVSKICEVWFFTYCLTNTTVIIGDNYGCCQSCDHGKER